MNEKDAPTTPQVMGRLGEDGQWRVLVHVRVRPPVWERDHKVLLDAEQAERLARQLLEYAALVRERLGLPGGRPFCPTAALHEGGTP